MTTDVAARPGLAAALRNLYYVRFGFAVVWAALLAATGAELGPLAVALLVIYPLFDVAAAVVDFRSSKEARPAGGLYANMALSLLAAAGLAVAASADLPAVLRVWGAWAITAGIVQLVVAIGRRRLGGQWPQILSGGLSTLAGTAFILQAGTSSASLTNLAGYATIGGVFFLVSAVRLHRSAKAGTAA
ncbi:hypothetical protein [Glycomyces harbinensis]|uniref:Integral membrane protein n=1 Tax=Glycomyces harbinensis TaxID=58114 RepID=A0A1G6XYD3_9ACTN|nr:hypothetical protein [Glycomyces harbinensis]SDD83080.1 hypothetical protein SAMN05216270_10826 [Glycomyces harbinensis]